MTLTPDEWLIDKVRYVVVSIGGIDTPLDRHRHHHHHHLKSPKDKRYLRLLHGFSSSIGWFLIMSFISGLYYTQVQDSASNNC
jgi:hypothetical protein